jgi:hypothetical protein
MHSQKTAMIVSNGNTEFTDFNYKTLFTSKQQVANKWTAFLVYQSVQK